jgi:hypothetical protein
MLICFCETNIEVNDCYMDNHAWEVVAITVSTAKINAGIAVRGPKRHRERRQRTMTTVAPGRQCFFSSDHRNGKKNHRNERP